MEKYQKTALFIHYAKKYRFAIIIFFFWLFVQFVLFHFFGISHGGDTERFTNAANYIITGDGIMPYKASNYMGYNLFLSLFFFIGLGEKSVVFVQVMLTLLATFCLYRLTYKLSNNKLAAFLSVILYILCLKLQLWNFYILTDSLFASMTMVSLYLISCLKNYKQLIYILPIVIWTASIRPSGFILLFSLVLFAIAYLWKIKKTKLLFFVFILFMLSLPIIFHIVDKVAINEHVVDYYLNGEIIWGYSKNALSAPKNVFIDPNYEKNSLSGVISFVLYNFAYVSKLAFLKLFYFLAHMKPFYASLQNWFIAITYYPVYILAIIGFFNKIRHYPTKILLISYFIGQTAIVMLTFENWDGRFLDVIMPIVYIFSALGLVKLLYYFPKTKLLENRLIGSV